MCLALGSMVFLLISSQPSIYTNKSLLDLLLERIDLTKWNCNNCIFSWVFTQFLELKKVLQIQIENQYPSCIFNV